MLYQMHNGAVAFGGTTVLENINFEIRNTEKIAVTGRNGCGKTTLLRLIAGEIELTRRDSDEHIYITQSGKPSIGYLKQVAFEEEEATLENEVRKAFSDILRIKEEMEQLLETMETDATQEMAGRYTNLQERFQYLGGYTFEKEYEIVLKKFGFTETDKKKPVSQFSGGQQTKIAFARMLLCKPDILLLDEPTNHLDMDTISWLETYLKEYPRAVIIVSHDRMFLDHIVDVVYEIEYGTAVRYPGNYSAFVTRKRLNWEKQKKDYELQKKEIARLQTIIDKFKNKPTKVAMTRSKLKQIEHMVKIAPPDRYNLKSYHANFKPARESVSDVLVADGLKIGYDRILSEVSIQQKKRQKIGIIGDNGVGKSTLLRTITGQIPPLGGEYKIGGAVDIGYFEQQMAQHHSDKTVLDDYWDLYPALDRNAIRSALGAFLFSGEDVFKAVASLSGGEKVRLALCKIFQTKPNYLILDEPTNHMDIVGKESLEAMLKEYEGTVLFVSHDRYFIKEVADALLVFADGQVIYYPYGYEQYEEARQKAAEPVSQPEQPTQSGNGAASRYMKGANPGKEEAKLKKRIEKLEGLIEEQESILEDIEKAAQDPQIQSDYVRLSTLEGERTEAEKRLKSLLEQWEEANDCYSQLPACENNFKQNT